MMLFILSSPLQDMDNVQEVEAGARDIQDNAHEARGSLLSSTHEISDLNVDTWRARTPLAPQDIS